MKKIVFIILFLSINVCSLKSSPQIYKLQVNGAISPASAEYIINSIETAEKEYASAVILELNTPGGLLESTRQIVQKILASDVPVIVYVAPSGSRAGSAGVFITLSANIAVMAPGTNIGAAHPVGMGTEDSSKIMFQKVTNDASAFIRSIAQKRNKNGDWAENAVRNSVSITENEALQLKVIDLIAPSMDSLLNAIDGKEVETIRGTVILHTKNAEIKNYEMNWRAKILAILTDPNIAYILLMIGIYGMLFEFWNPGSIFPGIIGGICLILGAYSMNMLPVNYAGLGLILLGVILFILEIKIVSHGLLTIGGVVSLLLGSLMLINSPMEFMSISLSVIISVVVMSLLFFSFIIGLGIKAQFRKKTTGKEALKGEIAVVITEINPESTGNVKLLGEIWKAASNTKIETGKEVIVEKVEGLVLRVKIKD